MSGHVLWMDLSDILSRPPESCHDVLTSRCLDVMAIPTSHLDLLCRALTAHHALAHAHVTLMDRTTMLATPFVFVCLSVSFRTLFPRLFLLTDRLESKHKKLARKIVSILERTKDAYIEIHTRHTYPKTEGDVVFVFDRIFEEAGLLFFLRARCSTTVSVDCSVEQSTAPTVTSGGGGGDCNHILCPFEDSLALLTCAARRKV